MGSGAAKKIDAIPMEMVVKIYSWEGLLFDSTNKLRNVLKDILENDSGDWEELDKQRKAVIFYNQQYTKSILSLQISQNRG